jgi:hypothetical protein
MSSKLTVKDTLINLYIELEKLLDIYEELMDTDVRDNLYLTLNYFFVWGKTLDRLPISYGMFSLRGDQSIASVVNHFLSSVSILSELSEISIGQERLDLLQNEKIVTSAGRQYYEFIGYSDKPLMPDPLPEDLFEKDNYDCW